MRRILFMAAFAVSGFAFASTAAADSPNFHFATNSVSTKTAALTLSNYAAAFGTAEPCVTAGAGRAVLEATQALLDM